MKTKLIKEDYLLITDINNPPLCKCGCGKPVKKSYIHSNKWNIYLFNHHLSVNRHLCKCGCGNRVEKIYQIYLPGHRTDKPKPLCMCGCGKNVYHLNNKYLPGHYELKSYQDRLLIRDSKIRKERPLCKCGCGNKVIGSKSIYYPGHYEESLRREKLIQIQQSIDNAPLCACGCGKKVKSKIHHPTEYNQFVVGHNHRTLEAKEKVRVICSDRHCPNIGRLEFEIFPKLQEVSPYKILCLDSQKKVKSGYHLDGYIEELNLVIEYDEQFHNGAVSQIRDPIRAENIYAELKCEFFRIKEKEWKENTETIIKKFNDKIIEISNSKNL